MGDLGVPLFSETLIYTVILHLQLLFVFARDKHLANGVANASQFAVSSFDEQSDHPPKIQENQEKGGKDLGVAALGEATL